MKIKKKMKTAKELNQEASGFKDGEKIETLLGKKLIIEGADEMEGDYGKYYLVHAKEGKRKLVFSTGSGAITKILNLNKFPFTGVIRKFKSKKRKGAEYYAFE